jgi:hypothetical protein
MKKLILIPLCFVLALSAEVAVKFYSSEPSTNQNRLLNIPTNVVSDVIFNTNSAPAEYILMTEEEYRTHQETVRPEFRNWFTNIYQPWALANSQPTSQQISNRLANIQALKDLSDSMQFAEDNWATLSNVQIQGVVRAHNQFLLRLRPILRDLYHQRLAEQ